MSKEIWIAIISASAGLITALGLNKVIPSMLEWFQNWLEERRKTKALKYAKIKKLEDRMLAMEAELDKHRKFEVQTKSTLNSMIPLMKEIMRDHPNYVKLLEQLERNIIGNEPEINFTPNGNE